MKKNICFDKRVDFPTMIGDITSISLDKNLNFVNESFIEGNLILKGSYKLTEASYIEENFEYNLPIEINLTERIDINTANIEISDFSYEIESNNIMNCYIELMLDAMEIIDDIDDVRECDSDLNKEIEIPTIEPNLDEDNDINNKDNDVIDDISNNKITDSVDSDINIIKKDNNDVVDLKDNDSLFFHLDEESETYGTFIVYIMRQNETINSIIEKYNTTVDELEKYNDLKDISIGSKIIIPVLND